LEQKKKFLSIITRIALNVTAAARSRVQKKKPVRHAEGEALFPAEWVLSVSRKPVQIAAEKA